MVKEIAFPAVRLVRKAVLQNLSILRSEGCLLSNPPRLALVERGLAAGRENRTTITGVTRGVLRDPPRPRTLPIGVLIGRLSAADWHRQRRHRDGTDQTATMHGNLPLCSCFSMPPRAAVTSRCR